MHHIPERLSGLWQSDGNLAISERKIGRNGRQKETSRAQHVLHGYCSVWSARREWTVSGSLYRVTLTVRGEFKQQVKRFSLSLHNMEEVIRQQYSEKEKLNIFNKEFMPHINSMYNFAYRLTLDADDSKDLLQDTYLKAFRFIDSFQQGTNAKAWLFRILKNSFINDYRKKSKEPSKIDYQEVETFYNSEDVDRQITPDLRVEALQDMIGDEISVALNSLDVDFRTVIILCDLEGFKYEEMAKILDIPIGTVRSRLHRARNLLKEKLSEYAKKMGYKNA